MAIGNDVKGAAKSLFIARSEVYKRRVELFMSYLE